MSNCEEAVRRILDLVAAYRLADHPQAALTELESAIRTALTAKPAGGGEAVAWQWRTKLDAAEGKDWVNCSREIYERAREYEDCETRALAVLNEPAPAPSKEQTNG